jgi:hypothetical protein
MQAQESVSKEEWDSLVAAAPQLAERKYTRSDETVLAPEKKSTQENDTGIAVIPHYLWDQQQAVMVDTLEDGSDYPLIVRKVPEKVMNELKADKALRYEKKKEKETVNPQNFSWLQKIFMAIIFIIVQLRFLILLLLLGGIGLLLFVFLKRNGYVFRRKKSDDLDTAVKLTDEELDVQTYQAQIEQAISAGKFRIAVRLLYLQTLRVLMDKGIVTYGKEKTNAAYLRSMISTPWYKLFATLTLDYEYIWYGEMPVDGEQFNVIHRQFSQFMNELGYTR